MRKACLLPALVLSACAANTPEAEAPKAARVETPSVLVQNKQVTREDDAIASDVRKVIRAEPLLKGLDIQVEANDGEITLTGKVPTPDERQRAEGLARTVPGVKDVNSRIELTK